MDTHGAYVFGRVAFEVVNHETLTVVPFSALGSCAEMHGIRESVYRIR